MWLHQNLVRKIHVSKSAILHPKVNPSVFFQCDFLQLAAQNFSMHVEFRVRSSQICFAKVCQVER